MGGGSDLYDETNVSEIPDFPSPRKKLATSKLTRERLWYNGYMQISYDGHMDRRVVVTLKAFNSPINVYTKYIQVNILPCMWSICWGSHFLVNVRQLTEFFI